MAKNEVPSNPSLVDWPTDLDGITSKLKEGLLDALGRMNGRQDKLDIIMATLKIGVGHTHARFAAQVAENEASAKWRAAQDAVREQLTPTKGYQSR